VLVMFSLAAAAIYGVDTSVHGFVEKLLIPALALVFVLVYNTFYQLTYRRFANIAIFNHVQLALDALVVTVLVYFSGGVYSWFDAMYLLFIIEAALILPKRRHVAVFTGLAIVAYGAALWLEYASVLPTISVPFAFGDLGHAFTLVAVRFLWAATMMAGCGVVATLIVDSYRDEARVQAEDSLLDHETGLYNRAHFFRLAARELERAERHRKALSVLLVDADDFDRFNRILGYEGADTVIGDIAAEIRDASMELGAADDADLATLFRFGGEEFAVLMPHEVPKSEALSAAQPAAVRFAERIRNRVRLVRRGELVATVSIGVATFPADGSTVEALVDAADNSIARALEEGGDRVVAALTARADDEPVEPAEPSAGGEPDGSESPWAEDHQPDEATPARPADG
jgi:diguanylate cyclase (GGDEF)-like protein